MGGWTGVIWSDLDHFSADRVIAEQINRFAGLARPWEWKHYSYDQPIDLPDRLLAAGFTPGPAETLLVAEIAELDLDSLPPTRARNCARSSTNTMSRRLWECMTKCSAGTTAP